MMTGFLLQFVLYLLLGKLLIPVPWNLQIQGPNVIDNDPFGLPIQTSTQSPFNSDLITTSNNPLTTLPPTYGTTTINSATQPTSSTWSTIETTTIFLPTYTTSFCQPDLTTIISTTTLLQSFTEIIPSCPPFTTSPWMTSIETTTQPLTNSTTSYQPLSSTSLPSTEFVVPAETTLSSPPSTTVWSTSSGTISIPGSTGSTDAYNPILSTSTSITDFGTIIDPSPVYPFQSTSSTSMVTSTPSYPPLFSCTTGKDCGSCDYTSRYSGILSSPDYPNSYGNRNCEYFITAAENHIIHLSFLDLSLKECCDSIRITYDVASGNEVCFTGISLPTVNNISSVSNEMVINFQSDGHGDNLSSEVFRWMAFFSVATL